MRILPRLFSAAVLTGIMVILGACSERSTDAQSSADAALQVSGAGATFPEPLYQEWILHLRKEMPGVAFSYEGIGSGGGVKRFIAQQVDFGASDAAMTDAEIEKVERGVELIPATAGMVVLAYNLPGIEGDLRLPRDVYADIFLGKIWRWDDKRIAAANPHLALPSKLIQVVSRRDSSGTTFAFTKHLSTINRAWQEEGPGTGKNVDWPGGAMTGRGNEGVAHKVKITQGSIGYMEYGFARRLGLPMALLQNKAGEFIRPDANGGRAALAAAATTTLPANLRLFLPDPDGTDSYPIVSLSWILAYASYPDADIAAALKDALNWSLRQGQPIAEEMGYIPLPEIIVAKASEAIARIN